MKSVPPLLPLGFFLMVAAIAIGTISDATRLSAAAGPARTPPNSLQVQAMPAAVATAAYDWRPVKIIDGGDMPSIVMHPAETGLMYIRANIGGAYRWDSPLQLWTPITDWISGPDWSLSGVESIAVDPTDSNRVYLVAGMYLSWSALKAAILISTDRGASFERVDLLFTMGGNDQGQQTGERLQVNPFNPAQLYLATHLNGLWQSADFGATWSQVTTFPLGYPPPPDDLVGLSFVRFDPRHRGSIYVGAYTGGIYRSTDGGTTWQSIPGQPTTLPGGETARPMRSALDSRGALYLSYANKSQLELISNGVVYRFDTEAGTWTNITPVDPQGVSGYGFCGIGVDPLQAGTVMVATWNRAWNPGDTIFRSTDSGATWNSLADRSVRDGSLSPFVYAGGSVTPFGNWISSVEIDPFDSNHALYTTGATVWSTHDLTNADSEATVHWTIGADGIEETAVNTLVSPTAGAHLLSGMGDAGGYRHDDFSVSQSPFLNPWMQYVSSLDFAASNPSLVVRVGLLDYNNNAAGAYSLDQGTTWIRFAANAPGVAGNPGMIAVSANGNALVWAPIAPTWVSSLSPPACSRDRGATWIPSAGAPTNLWIAADRVNSNKFYGFHGPTGTAYVSLDGGATFAATATGLPQDAGNNVTNQARPQTVPGREGDIWLPLATGLYHSTDSGANFSRISSFDSAPLVGFGQAALGGNYPAVYAVGTIGGVYGIFRSDDQAATWTRINDDRHQFGLLSVITGDPRIYGRVYLGTSGRGIIYGDLQEALNLVTQPQSQLVPSGQNATFTAVASGAPAPTYQWQRQASGTTTWANLGDNTTYSGALTTSLTVNSVAAAMNGDSFRCVITNSNGTVTTAQAALVVETQFAVVTFAGQSGTSGHADGTGSAARFNSPADIAVDGSGNIYVADTDNDTVRMITPSGAVTTLAGQAGVSGSNDGSGSALFNHPAGIAVDGAGNAYVADTNNNTIRKLVIANGTVTTLAGHAGVTGSSDGNGAAVSFDGPSGIAVDAAGNLYVSDTLNHTIRKVTVGGAVTTIAGSAGSSGFADATGSTARFHGPQGLALDASGDLFVADTNNNVVRRIVTATGVVTTVAGQAGIAGSTDGAKSQAQFHYPSGIAVDAAGNLYVADTDNHTLREVAASGAVSTLSGLAGSSGSADGMGSAVRFDSPTGVAVDGTGNIYVADTNNDAIRLAVTPVAPAISQQPQSQTVTAGSSVQFSVTASGSPTVTYQWYFGGAVISGATSSTYNFSNAQATNAGNYTVVVSNAVTSVTSNVATLTVSSGGGGGGGGGSSGSGGGGGGGAPSTWFCGALLLLAACRRFRRRGE
jgi:sugar lactone lactonase YvrE